MRTAVLAVLVVLAPACSPDSDVSRELGARCTTADDCDDRCLPPDPAYPGGICTLTCLSDSECPSGSTCVDREGGVCLFDCAADRDCTFLGDGWTCKGGEAREDHSREVNICRGD